MAQRNQVTGSAMAKYIDGQQHRVTLEECGLASLTSAANSFRCACYARHLGCTTRIDGDCVIVQSLTLSQAMVGAKTTTGRRSGSQSRDERMPVVVTSQFSRLTDQYLRTIPGTAQARELSGLLVQLSRAAQ